MNEPVGLGVKTLLFSVSLFLALLLWTYVKSTQPLGVHYLKVPVQEFNGDGLPKNLIVGRLDSAWIEVSGPEDTLANAIEDITDRGIAAVYVDLSTAHVGTDRYPLRITLAKRDLPYKVGLSDHALSVTIEERDQIPLPVTVEEIGQIPAEKNLAFNGATAKPSMVNVSGAINTVRGVKKIRALLDLSTVDSSAILPIRLEALDGREQPVPGVTLDPDTISLAVGVAPAPLTKSVLVDPVLNGQPAFGYSPTEVSVEPNQVAVRGLPEALARISKVRTRAIALNDLRATTSFEVPLEMPPGVRPYSIQKVRVRVTIEPNGSTRTNQTVPGP